MTFTSSVYADRQAVTASAVPLAVSGQLSHGLVMRAKSTNVGPVYVGGETVAADASSSGNGFALAAGESLRIPANLAQSVYIIGTALDVVEVFGA